MSAPYPRSELFSCLETPPTSEPKPQNSPEPPSPTKIILTTINSQVLLTVFDMAAVQSLAAAVGLPFFSRTAKDPASVQVIAIEPEPQPEPEKAEGKFQYSTLPLPRGSAHIRLVELKPGPWSADIECDMTVVPLPLDGAKPPSYETISYVWGDPTIQHPIKLNGCQFNVTENLFLALRRLRRSSESRTLWVDAICIYQDDDDEKAYQVGMMGDIYKGCSKCTIWLGEDPESLSQADDGTGQSRTALLTLEMFDMFASGVHLSEMKCFSPAVGVGTSMRTIQRYRDNFEAVKRMASLPWWQRVWVIQELVLPDTVEFVYSSKCFPYSTLAKVTEELTKHSLTCCKTDALSLAGDMAFDVLMLLESEVAPLIRAREQQKQPAKESRDGGSVTLFQLRNQFFSRQATNKRDLFYGLLSLVSKRSSSHPVQPNYAIPLREAVTEAAFACVLEGGMDFLIGERARHMSDSIFSAEERQRMPDLPSWIPDTCFLKIDARQAMSQESRLWKYYCFEASGAHKQAPSELYRGRDGVLSVQTLKVDQVAQVGPVCEITEYNIGRALLAGRQWMSMAGVDFWNWPSQMPPEGEALNTLWRTVLYDSAMKSRSTATADSYEGTEAGSHRRAARELYRRLTPDDYVKHQKLWGLFSPFVSEWGSWLFDLAPSVISLFSGIAAPLQTSFGAPGPEALLFWVVQAPEILLHLGICVWDQRMYVTKGGKIGLAPAGTEIGDEVHVVLGAAVPFILRRKEEVVGTKEETKKDAEVDTKEGTTVGSVTDDTRTPYTIVGNCFQLDIMNGEALERKGLEAVKTVTIH